jgi:hypothetical protein
MNLFEKATREKFRFPSSKGELVVEQLWQLPLLSKTGSVDLNAVAVALNAELKALGEESFVETGSNPKRALVADKLDLVKYIISVKQDENKAVEKRLQNQQQVAELEELLRNKQKESLAGLSEEQIREKLAALRAK